MRRRLLAFTISALGAVALSGGIMMRRSLIVLAVLASSSHVALAADVLGEWARDDGKAKVRFVSCGGAVCGSISWLQDTSGPGKIGQQVFFDMKPSGDSAWAGSAFNPEDGKTYTGKMTMTGRHLLTSGCIFGGLLCKTAAWTRAQ